MRGPLGKLRSVPKSSDSALFESTSENKKCPKFSVSPKEGNVQLCPTMSNCVQPHPHIAPGEVGQSWTDLRTQESLESVPDIESSFPSTGLFFRYQLRHIQK